MALHELNLWTVSSRTGSSLDVSAKYGGLQAGRIDLPEAANKAKGFKLRISGKVQLESYSTLSEMVTAIGGTLVTTLTGHEKVIEFNTTTSTTGARGIYSVEGIFVKDWHPEEALTKGKAEAMITPLGVDEYKWTGTQNVANGSSINLLSLNGFSTDISTGESTLNASSIVILPVSVKPRGILITVILDGEYVNAGPHDLRIQLRSADGTTIQQSSPLYVLDKKLNKTVATFATFTNGVYDELSTTGFKLQFLNDSTSAVDLKGVRIVVQNISNPDFTRM